MVSTRLPTSKSSSLFNKPLVTVPKTPITIGIIVTFMFHSFFNSLARSWYLSIIIIIIIIIISSSSILLLVSFYISLKWWSFTGVWGTASLLKSPGPFPVFWLLSIMLLLGCSPLVRQLPSPPVPLVIFQ